MALNKVTYTNHQTVITAENLNDIQDEIIVNAASISAIAPEKYGFAYGTCSTAASTAAKTATITGYQLVKNSYVAIRFTNAVPASSTLNINSLGAKAIYHNNAAITEGVINAGYTALFIYDGSYYRLLAADGRLGDPFIYKSFTSSDSLDDIHSPLIAWCNNVAGRPSTAGTYGILFQPTDSLQLYYEFGGNGVPRQFVRIYTNSQWYPWKASYTDFIAGDVLSLPSTGQYIGSWPNTNQIRFLIPLTRPISASSASISGGMIIRCNGNNSTTSDLSSAGTINSVGITDCGLVVNYTFTTAPSTYQAGHAAVVQPVNMTVTFS